MSALSRFALSLAAPIALLSIAACGSSSTSGDGGTSGSECSELSTCCMSPVFGAAGVASCISVANTGSSSQCAAALADYVASGQCGDTGASAFLGTWKGTSGMTNVACNGMSNGNTVTPETVTIMSDGSGGVDIVTAECTLDASVSGGTASVMGGTTCTATGDSALTLSVTSGTFTIDGKDATLSYLGDTSASGASCTYSVTLKFTKES